MPLLSLRTVYAIVVYVLLISGVDECFFSILLFSENRYETEKKPIFPKILWIQRSQFLGKFQEMEIRTKYLHQMESAIFSPRQSLFHVHGSTAGDI
ncbi:hypothetical protein COP2_046734 [Malus domestica]